MNRFSGRISSIATAGSVSRVGVDIGGAILSAVILETPATASYLRMGNAIVCLFKETEVGLARGLTGELSFGNRIDGVVESVENGELFTRVRLACAGGTISALLGAPEASAMRIQTGDTLTALIHPGEISFMVLGTVHAP